MNLKNPNSKRLGVLLIIFALSLAAVLSSIRNMTTSASYGYKEGDTYTFTIVWSQTAKTEEGESSGSSSVSFTIKLKNVERSTGGFNVSVERLVISASSGDGSHMITPKQTVEGDPVPFTGNTWGVMGSPNLLISNDWDKHGDEWKAFVESEGKQDGWSVKEKSSSNGAFLANFDLDVSSTQSHTDFDGDGKADSYTGSNIHNIQYDSNGVLSSYSVQGNWKFDTQNSFATSMTVSRGAPGPDMMTMLTYAAIGVISFVVAFATGFFIGKSRRPKTAAMYSPETNASAPPPR